MIATLSQFWRPAPEQLALFAPILILLAGVLAVLIVPLAGRVRGRIIGGLAMAAAILAGLAALHLLVRTDPSQSALKDMLLTDRLSLFFQSFLALFLTAVIVLWLTGPSGNQPHAPEFFALLIGSAIGMSLMTSTLNLLMIVIATELASLSSYALVAFRKHLRSSAEAALKYSIFGAVCSAIMLYGISLLYGYYHTLDIPTIAGQIAATAQAGQSQPLLLAAALLAVFVGVAFKISAVPFHYWCPDAFEGAQIEVTTWLSVASKAAGLVLLLRLVLALASPAAELLSAAAASQLFYGVSLAVGIVATATCTIGNLAAFWQNNLKRLLAYSSIAHAGYMLMAAAILTSKTNAGISAVTAYLLVYLFMNLGAFGAVALVYWATGKETIDAYNGLGRRAPLVAVCMAICLFSLVGAPPMGGFVVKYWLLVALFGDGLYWLVLVAVFNTLLSLFYYLRIIKAMFFIDDGQPTFATPLAGKAILIVCTAVILLSGTLLIGPLKNSSDHLAARLYPPSVGSTAIALEHQQ